MDFKHFVTGVSGKGENEYVRDLFLEYIEKLAKGEEDKIDIMLDVITMNHWDIGNYVDIPYDTSGDLKVREFTNAMYEFIGDCNTNNEEILDLIVDNYANNKRIESIVTPWGFWISLNE